MAQSGAINLRIGFDGPSMEAARADIERHILKYGDNPAPHLKAEAERNMARILDCMKTCIYVEDLDPKHTRQ